MNNAQHNPMLADAIRSAEISHSGMTYGDEKNGAVSEYARGWGDCLKAIKGADVPSDECSHRVKLLHHCEQCRAQLAADFASLVDQERAERPT
jgi:hypothetical protein